MFGIGLGELLILLLIGTLILGPSRCVELAKTLGKTWGKLNKEFTSFSKEFTVDEEVQNSKRKRPSTSKK